MRPILKKMLGFQKLNKYKKFSITMVFVMICLFSGILAITKITNKNFSFFLTAQAANEKNPNLQILTTKLLQAIKKYELAGPEEKTSALEIVKTQALQRELAMSDAVENNPSDFLLNALPKGIIKNLPEEILPFIEQEQTIKGRLDVRFLDYFSGDNSHSGLLYFLVTDEGKKYNLSFSHGINEKLLSGTEVTINATALQNYAAINTDASGNIQQTTLATNSSAMGVQTTLVMPINFTNNLSRPWTVQEIADTMFYASSSVNSYYTEETYGQTTFTGSVTPWITVPYTNENCNIISTSTNKTYYEMWADAADQAALAMGYNPANYQRRVYVMAVSDDATKSSCGWAGISYLGGTNTRTWTSNYNDSFVYAHELGHSLGMMHASTILCGTKAIDSYGNCIQYEYADRFDVMGYKRPEKFHNNVAHKLEVGWLPISSIKPISTSGIYTVYPLENNNFDIKALQIEKPDSKSSYFIDYRQLYGSDSLLPANLISGVSLIVSPSHFENNAVGLSCMSCQNTTRIDTTPNDGEFWDSTPLLDSKSFQDVINGISVTQLSHSSSSATVKVDFTTPPCTKNSPTVSVSPQSQTTKAGFTVSYKVSVTNNDATNCPSTTFGFSFANLPSTFANMFSGNLTLAPKASGTVQAYLTPNSDYPDSTNIISVVATDIYNSAHTNSAPFTLVVYTPPVDTTAPVVSITSPLNGYTITAKDKTINILVNATDNVGVTKVDIIIDGSLMVTDISSPYSYSWNVSKLKAGNHTIAATAYDAAGNTKTASITVKK